MAKLTKEDKEIIKRAEKLWSDKYLSQKHSVASIMISKTGKEFEGMSMEFECGVGICAERTSMFKMLPDENEIRIIVAVYKNKIIPPCGVCREVMFEMNSDNLNNTWVIVSKNKKVKLKELFPYDWSKAF